MIAWGASIFWGAMNSHATFKTTAPVWFTVVSLSSQLRPINRRNLQHSSHSPLLLFRECYDSGFLYTYDRHRPGGQRPCCARDCACFILVITIILILGVRGTTTNNYCTARLARLLETENDAQLPRNASCQVEAKPGLVDLASPLSSPAEKLSSYVLPPVCVPKSCRILVKNGRGNL